MNRLKNKIFCGGNLKIVSPWKPNCVDGIVTDPPYELGFMGKGWDSSGIAFSVPMWKQMLRITKPGGFLLCFGGTRTYHRLACAIEDAGWGIRDCMMWLYGSGFPKSHNISKAIDKSKGAERKVIRIRTDGNKGGGVKTYDDDAYVWDKPFAETASTTPLAKLWDGYGTALKPAWEPIIIAMKPLDGTFAHNAEKHGVAGLNIDGGRIGTEQITAHGGGKQGNRIFGMGKGIPAIEAGSNPHQGRWPANLILDEEVAEGESWKRYFYCAKTSRKERNMGMEDCEDKLLARSGGAQGAEKRGETEYLQKHIGLNRVAVVKNNHPTVKPLALMRYLCTLLKMPGSDQIILDPFLGSGTTGIACKELGIDFIGIEKEQEYCEIAVKRIGAVEGAEIILSSETSLPVTKNVSLIGNSFSDKAKCRRPCPGEETLLDKPLEKIKEQGRQSIIDAAVRKLKSP